MKYWAQWMVVGVSKVQPAGRRGPCLCSNTGRVAQRYTYLSVIYAALYYNGGISVPHKELSWLTKPEVVTIWPCLFAGKLAGLWPQS